MVFSVSALFTVKIICADQASLPNGALQQENSNEKLLMALVITKQQTAFEQGMADAGWDINKPHNLAFYNVRQIIARNDIMSLQDQMDKKISAVYHSSRSVDSSA